MLSKTFIQISIEIKAMKTQELMLQYHYYYSIDIYLNESGLNQINSESAVVYGYESEL